MKPFLTLWLPVLLWMGFIFYLSSQPDLPHPKAFGLETVQDPMAHFLEYAILTGLLYRTNLGKTTHPLHLPGPWLFSFGIAFLYALSDELHQSFVPFRQASWLDVATDVAGSLGALVVLHLRQRAKHEPRQNV